MAQHASTPDVGDLPAGVRPFTIDFGEDAVTDLHGRLDNTRWPDAELVDDWSQGIPVAYVRELVDYWRNDYHWAERQDLLNRFPQFMTEIDGVDIHFVWARSPHTDAMPLVITHGWPGSVVEFQQIIDPLIDPVAHGGSASEAFDVVCPSLPGFGFSSVPPATGYGIERIASMWSELMVRLGYDRFVAQGGDWGAAVTTQIGANETDHCFGIHLNMPVGRPTREQLQEPTEDEQRDLERRNWYDTQESGYARQQSTRPQTLGYALADSPVGQLTWIAEKFWSWTDNDGSPEDAISRDVMLDNVMVYWLTNTATSSARLYWESLGRFGSGVVDIPTGCSVFPKEIVTTSRRWAENRYTDLRYWNELDKGGHFAALEQPEVFVDELRSCFALLRD